MKKLSGSQTGSRRLFIAVKITPDKGFLDAFLLIKNKLSDEKIRWVKVENLHITLRFLGDTDPELIPPISSQLTMAFRDKQAFGINLKAAGVFRNIQNPKVLWIGIQDTAEISALRKSMDIHLRTVIDLQETEDEHFHLTVGRMKGISNRMNLKELIRIYYDFNFLTTRVEKVILFESILGKTGPVYKELAEFPLQGRSD